MMGKTQTQSAISAYRIALGQGIYEDEVGEAHEFQNYACYQNPWTHVCLATGGDGELSTNSLATHDVEFPQDTSYAEYFAFRTYIDADVTQLLVSAQCTFTSTNTGSVRVTVDGANVELTFTSASATDSDTINTSSMTTGSGEVAVTIELKQTGASQPSGMTLDLISIQDQPIAAGSMPDPPDE